MTLENNLERELGWDDEITVDGQEFTLLPPGDYDFEVTSFERGRHEGSDKLPPCNKAVLSLRFDGGENGVTTIKHNLFLHSRTEGMIANFLVAIGQKKHGEPTKPRWTEMVGATGRAKLTIRKWKGNNGEEMESNQVSRFYDPEEKPQKSEEKPSYQAGSF